MTIRRIEKHPKRSSGSRPGGREWVGGRMVSPFYITEGTPYRPEMILWVEKPEGVVVHFTLVNPADPPVSFAATLREAMKSPLIGSSRRPETIRVADSVLARELRQDFPQVRVVEAPTPELSEVIESMAEALGHKSDPAESSRRASYFEDGRVGIKAVETLFGHAKLLYGFAPWKTVADSQVLRMDIPAYGVEGGCLSIIGTLGESTGLVLFPSLDAFEKLFEAAETLEPGETPPLTLYADTLSLNFETGSDLPKGMYREVLEHGWPVADTKAYPVVMALDSDGIPRPLFERDIRVMSACALSLTTFFIKYARIFESETFQPICESFHDGNDLEVRFTVPAHAGPEFAVNAPRRAKISPRIKKPKFPRNRPCPCGSGKKYKLCCLNRDQAEARAKASDAESLPDPSHDLDEKLLAHMARYAERRWGRSWGAPVGRLFRNTTLPPGLLGPWMFYHHLFDGKPIVQWFLEDQGDRLPKRESDWLAAQLKSWLSIWEVLEVDPGRSATMRDLLTDETRVVRETTATKILVKRDAVLACIIDYRGRSVFCGMYARSLPPAYAAGIVQRVHKRLRRKSSIPVERMREEAVGRYLIRRWEEAVAEAETRAGQFPELQNIDGDPVLITIDHFEFDSADRKEIARRLATTGGVDDPPKPGDPEPVFIFTNSEDPEDSARGETITGTATLAGRALRMESNSIRRADAMRTLLEARLGVLIKHRIREHSDPKALLREGRPGLEDDPGREYGPGLQNPPRAGDPGPLPHAAELDAIVLRMKGEHYADWADHPLPALDGETPRAAVQTRAGRQKVDTLLKESENMEAKLPDGQRFDFGSIRRDLGLPE